MKPAAAFYQSAKYAGGLSAYCRGCTSIRNRIRSPEQKGHTPEKSAAYYRENKGRIAASGKTRRARLQGSDPAAYRAKKFFDVVRDDVASDVTPQYLRDLFASVTHCQCCGVKLALAYEDRSTRAYRANPAAPSIDRVNNAKGYARNNIAVICWTCNYRKTNLTLDDLAMFERYIRRHGDVD